MKYEDIKWVNETAHLYCHLNMVALHVNAYYYDDGTPEEYDYLIAGSNHPLDKYGIDPFLFACLLATCTQITREEYERHEDRMYSTCSKYGTRHQARSG
jgi:hypothetical protein